MSTVNTRVTAVAWTLTLIAIIAFLLRFYVFRRFYRSDVSKKRDTVKTLLQWSISVVLLALIFSIIAAALVTKSVELGLGQHTSTVIELHGIDRAVRAANWQSLAYGSFLPNFSNAIHYSSLSPVFQQPRIDTFSYFASAFMVLTDLVIVGVQVWTAHYLEIESTPLRYTVLCSPLVPASLTIGKILSTKPFTSEDPLWDAVLPMSWALIEMNVRIIVPCSIMSSHMELLESFLLWMRLKLGWTWRSDGV